MRIRSGFYRPLIIIVFTFLLLVVGVSCRPSGGESDNGQASEPEVYIENKGSDTIVNLALAWAERYQNNNSNIRISVTGGGSGTGIAALINNTVDIANASRQIKEKEIENAQDNGVEPIEYVIARDAIAVIVHPDNPIDELTIEQISAIFTGELTNWSQLGGEDRPIVRLSRETNSGTHVYFLENVLRMGNDESDLLFSMDTLLLPSSEGIIKETSQNQNTIGYDGLGYVTDEVKVIGVAEDVGGEYIYPSVETVNSGLYPIARELYMYTNGEPTGELLEYMEWIFSEEAQTIVAELGFVPIIQP
ncbi:MAG: phosphate ABC transporter substrate-binding protein PstS family protein [Aliifodinibius sp.]|nr:phosphate ABC transporter substrate-binding protein PstS family protein [Fodinibius sp.]